MEAVFNTRFLFILLGKSSRAFHMTVSAGDEGQLPAERGINLKEKKINQGGKHHFTKSLGTEGVHPRFLEEFQEGAAELQLYVTR